MSNCLSLNTKDWLTNLELRMCSAQERGVWLDVLCLMQQASETGILRWPLSQIAQAAGCEIETLRSLARKGVLKGQDAGDQQVHGRTDLPFIFRPMHARKRGEEVVLIEGCEQSLWFCDWLVTTSHKRRSASAVAKVKGHTPPKPALATGTDVAAAPLVTAKNEVDSAVPGAECFELTGDAPPSGKRASARKQLECPYRELADAFLARFPHAPRPRVLDSTTRLGKAMMTMWRRQAEGQDTEFSGYETKDQGMAKWCAIFELAMRSKFLRGDVKPREGSDAFRISLDWFMTSKSIERVLNGYYHREEGSNSIASGVQESAARVAEMMARRAGGQGSKETDQVTIF